jgi:hypothetical protein
MPQGGHDVTLYSNDYVGIQLSKAKQEELRREAERMHQAKEVMKLQPVRPILQRIRLPKITISWN